MTTSDRDEPLYLGFHAPEDVARLAKYHTQWDAPPGPIALHRAHGPVARINLYVGANNSGKSRLLRALLQAQPSSGLLAAAHGLRARAIADLRDMSRVYPPDGPEFEVKMRWGRVRGQHCFIDPSRIAWAHAELERWPLYSLLDRETVDVAGRLPGSADSPSVGMDGPVHLQFKLWESLVAFDYAECETDGAVEERMLGERWPHVAAFADVLKLRRSSVAPASRVYIPVLRSAHTLHGCGSERGEAGDVFLRTVVENYQIAVSDETPSCEVFTGLQLYEQVLRDRCGPKRTRERVDAFERFLGEQFFDGQSVEIVPRYTREREEQHIFVKIGERAERELHNLGDGINALILILYKIFTAEPGTWIFIEEPELNLHPGLQRIFLKILLREAAARNLRVFMTTHSNHLVGMAMHHPREISVFALTPETSEASSFLVRAVQGPELALLDELGVDNASVFLANCSLWVEGACDRIYLRGFFLAYERAGGPKLREDLDFAFFEYGGSSFTHYLFGGGSEADVERIRAQFVANRVFLLADQDDGGGAARKHARDKYADLRAAARAGDAFQFATTEPAREIENLLAPAALRALLRHQRERLDPALKDVDPELLPWDALTTEDRLARKYHENFAALLAGTGVRVDFSASRKKMAIADAFARAVEAGQIVWEDLGDEAQALTRTICGFIARHNPARGPA